MEMRKQQIGGTILRIGAGVGGVLMASAVLANGPACKGLPGHAELQGELASVVAAGGNAGLGNDMWGTIVDRDGVVCAVAFTGDDRGDQWPGSRVISAQKANTANAFSLSGNNQRGFKAPLSTANLYEPVQPGNSLFGLQFSNPVDTDVAYGGNAKNYGRANDPMVGGKIGGVNVFGGGLALYDAGGNVVGALGVSGDTSCTDHIIAWKVRDGLKLDNIPDGVAGGTDNILFFTDNTGMALPTGGFGHPLCLNTGEFGIATDLPNSHPIGP